eukprot:TRINITY_DN2275_c0_g2_i62.p1 TRINITY_DN2275_c0_g2~~TRINITY_DN2275_c0_g2_i62.p1  ORF type:complete len:247 (+),score=59.41 TRINITY_DN2275_c0_g2_i62:31-771(+)
MSTSLLNRVGAPSILSESGDYFHVVEFAVDVKVHIATAVITIWATYVNDGKKPTDAKFYLPTSEYASISSVAFRVGDDQVVETMVIPQEEAKSYVDEGDESTTKCEKYMPGVFELPLFNVGKKTRVEVVAKYMENLDYTGGQYLLNVPLTFHKDCFPGKWGGSNSIEKMMNFNCSINTGAHACQVNCNSHSVKMKSQVLGLTDVVVDKWANRDFVLQFVHFHPQLQRFHCPILIFVPFLILPFTTG